MGWYRGQYVIGRRSLAQMIAKSKKDYHFRVVAFNQNKKAR